MDRNDKLPFVRVCCMCHKLYINNVYIKDDETYEIFHKEHLLTHGYCEECLNDTLEELGFLYKVM